MKIVYFLFIFFLLAGRLAYSAECSAIFPGNQTFAANGTSNITGSNTCNGSTCNTPVTFSPVSPLPTISPVSTFTQTTISDGIYESTAWGLANDASVVFSGAGTAVLYFNSNVTIPKATEINKNGAPENVLIVVYGSLTVSKDSIINALVYVAGSANFAKDINFSGALSVVDTLSVAKDGFYDFNVADVNNVDSHGFCAPIVPTVEHFEIIHDGNGLTCDAESVIIKACLNNDCSTLSTDAVSLDFLGDGSLISAQTFTGSTTFNFNHTTAETLTLSVANPTITPNNSLVCSGGVGNSCDLIFADAGFRFLYGAAESTTIDNQMAGSNFAETLKLQAVENTNGVCTALFTGDKDIELSQLNVNPSGTAGLDFKIGGSGGTTIAKHPTFTTGITLNFAADSKATVSNPNYLDAGQIQLHAQYNVGGISLVGSSNNFWVQPAKLIVTAQKSGADLNGATDSATTIHKAGEVFDFQVKAVNALGTTTPNYSPGNIELLLDRTGPTSGGVDGTFYYESGSIVSALSPTYQSVTLFNFNSGSSTTNNAYYSEVGLLNLDLQDTDYGGVGITIAGDAINIGRFTPDHFTVTVTPVTGIGSFLDTCQAGVSDFTYVGQPFSYFSEPELTITAENALNTTTQNYTQAGYQKLIASGVSRTFPTEDTTTLGEDSVTKMQITHTKSDGTLAVASGGVLTYTFDSGDSFTFTKDSNSLSTPFVMDYDILITAVQEPASPTGDSISDSSGVGSAGMPLTVTPLGSNIRFGRWNIENAFGPETSDLPLPMQVQTWDGSNFITNLDDNCTVFDATVGANVTLNNTALSPALDPTKTTALGAGTFVLGLAEVQLQKTSDGSQGQVRFIYNDTPDWLKYDWDGDDAYDDLPEGVGAFGLFRGNDRIILWREVVN